MPLLLQRSGVSAGQLLVNPGFEAGTNGWEVNSLVEAGCQPRSGTGVAALVSGGGQSQAFLRQVVEPLAHGTYVLSGYGRGRSGSGTLTATLIWRDATGAEVLRTAREWSLDGEYSLFSLAPLQPPPRVSRLVLQLSDASPPGNGVCLDDLVLDGPALATPVPPSSATAKSSTTPTTATQTPQPAASPTPSARPPAAATVTAPAPTSVFTNGGFEEGTKAWQKFGGELSAVAAPKRSGNLAGLLASSTSSTKWAYQTVAVEAGLTYEFSGYVRAAGEIEAAFLRLSWYASADGSGEAIAADDSTGRIEGASSDFVFLSTGPRSPPATARSLRVRVLLAPTGQAAAGIFLDDFALTASPRAEATPGPVQAPAIQDTATAGQPAAALLADAPAAAPTAVPVSARATPRPQSAAADGTESASSTDEVASARRPGPAATAAVSGPLVVEGGRRSIGVTEVGAFALVLLASLGAAHAWARRRGLLRDGD